MGKQINGLMRQFAKAVKGDERPFHLEIIKEPKQILQYDIAGIPAMIVGGQVLGEGRVPSVAEITNSIQAYHIPMEAANHKREHHIRRILVPVDLSDAARNALSYVKDLANKLDAAVHILHVSRRLAEVGHAITENHHLKTDREAFSKGLSRMISEVFPPSGENSPTIIHEVGFPVDIIEEKSEEFDLVVMGATGEHGVVDKMLGSISSGVAERAKCPVLLVPKHSHPTPIHRMLYACKANFIYNGVADQLLDLAPDNGDKEVHFVEVLRPEDKRRDFMLDTDLIKDALSNDRRNIHYFVDQVEGHCVVNELNSYAQKHDIDLMVMVTKHRSLLGRLLHSSQTKRMALGIQVPVLVLHL